MALAIAVFLLVVGSLVFHFASPWWFTDLAADWATIDLTVDITFWVTGFVFVAVNVFMAWCIYRYRRKKGHKAVYEPENARLEWGLSIFTTVGVIAMLAPGLFVWATFVTVPDDALDFEVLGQQWQWQFRYPGADGELGTADTRLVSEANPFGIATEANLEAYNRARAAGLPEGGGPYRPLVLDIRTNGDGVNAGLDDVLVNGPDMRLPVGRPVRALLRSNDVLHNYTVAQFRVKMDLVPGLTSYLWFEPTVEGTYDILCEELCGIGHFVMRGSVTVEPPPDFDAWLAARPTFAETLAAPGPDLAAGRAAWTLCAACHGAQGEGNRDLDAPSLAGQPAWYTARQLEYFRNGVRGGEGDVYGRQMAPMAMTLADADAARDVAAWIEAMPPAPSAPTVSGDVGNGRDIYDRNCSACHLPDAAGTWYTDAPGLAGMDDWYLVRQISNFRARIRGAHPGDAYGEQMVEMATAMAGLDEVEDVVAYINTLRTP